MRILALVLATVTVLAGEEPRSPAAVEAELWAMVPEPWRPVPVAALAEADIGKRIIAAGRAVDGPSVDEESLWQAYQDAAAWWKPWPTGAAADALLAWMEAPERAEAPAILDRALEAEAGRTAGPMVPGPVASPGRDLMRFLVLRCRRAVEVGDGERAEIELRRMSGLGRSLRGGQGGLGLLLDCALASQATHAVIAVAARTAPDAATIGRLRRLIPPAEAPADGFFPRMVLGDLIPVLARAPEDGDRWVRDLQGMHLSGALLRERMRDTTGSSAPVSDRSAIFALAGNPAALDRKATVELALSLLSVIGSADGGDAWTQGPVRDLVEEVGQAGCYLNPAHDLMADLISRPDTAGDAPGMPVGAVRREDGDFRLLAGRPNPIGKILVGLQVSALPILIDSGRAHEARYRMAHLALSLIERRIGHGELPASLPPAAPVDPFTGKPFRWDASRCLLWSVGRNRTDEQGDPRKDDVLRLHAESAP